MKTRARAQAVAVSAPCPLCGEGMAVPEEALAAVVRAAPDRLVRCAGCALVRRDPPISTARAAQIYDDAYYRVYEQSVGMAGDLHGVLRPHLRRRLEAVERRLGVGRLLEIGCGKGALLEYARDRGWTTRGVEISEAAGRVAREKGLDVHIGPVETMSTPPEPPDFVHMNHVLEHLADPVRVLRQVRELLAPGGIAVVEVPNEFDNLFFHVGRALLPQSRRLSPVPSTHQCFFNPQTLQRAICAAGLAVERCRTVRWTIGDRSNIVGRAIRRAIYLAERPLERAGNIEAVVRHPA